MSVDGPKVFAQVASESLTDKQAIAAGRAVAEHHAPATSYGYGKLERAGPGRPSTRLSQAASASRYTPVPTVAGTWSPLTAP